MCGIVGFAREHSARSSDHAASVVGAMTGTLAHRGPDDHGVWASENGTVALGHRRLAIVDLSPLGHNPMPWDGGRLWVTYNGEIYNYRELRATLEAAGHQFRSQTDTEVVLAAYDEWGTACVERFAGMFAFGLWDQARERLWLARDRFGKKPLYYSLRDGALVFASELKALVADPSCPRGIDQTAVGLYLRYGYIPAPLSIYTAIRKLPQGHEAIFERGTLQIRRYWDPAAYVGASAGLSDADAERTLEQLLGTAVEQRRIADVPLGAFLSGGIDSSLVVALMQEQSATPVQTFTIRFENKAFNEADHAAAVAKHLGTEHHEEVCTAERMLDVVGLVPRMYDEPFADSSAIPTYLVSSVARQRVTVALSGDGGDELFAGYPRYAHFSDSGWVLELPRPVRLAAAAVAARLPARRLRRIADVLRDDEHDHYGRFVSWRSRAEVTRLMGVTPADAPLYADMLRRVDGVARDQWPGLLDIALYLPDDILAKVDRASMAVSLEVRAPLLDHRVAEFAIGLPMHLKRRGRATKWILRQLLYKRVPPHLIDRPKMGFGVPLADWFRGPLRGQMAAICAGLELAELGLDPGPVRREWASFLAGGPTRPDLLWQIYMLVAWARESAGAGQPHAG